MDRKRNHNMPSSLQFLMWPALVRAPWLIGSLMDPTETRDGSEDCPLRSQGRSKGRRT